MALRYPRRDGVVPAYRAPERVRHRRSEPKGAPMPAKKDMPSTIQRSPKKAQDTWGKTHDSAVDEYGEGERAHRTAFASLKHSFEKVGDHWEEKGGKGPSDKQAAKSGASARRGGKSAEGVDANASKAHLQDVA